MNPLDKYVHLKGLMDSVDMTVLDRSDVLLFFAVAIYRASLTALQRSVMDGREICTFKDLNKLALSLNSTDNDRSGGARGQWHGAGEQVKCFKCHRLGHKSFECRAGRGKSGVVYYSCHQPGHKAPECPNKSQGNQKEQVKSEGYKKLGLKSGSKPFNTNWVAVEGNTPVVKGRVNDVECSIVPDTGAEVTVVSGCLVYEAQILPEKVQVRGATGGPVSLCTAEVMFELEGRSFSKVVAVAQEGMLNGKVLYAVPMDDSKAKRLLLGAAPLPKEQGSGLGHSGDTPDTQSSPDEDAASAGIAAGVVDAPQLESQQAEETLLNVVTRAGSWLDSLSNETHNRQDEVVADPSPLVEKNAPAVVSEDSETVDVQSVHENSDSNVAVENDESIVAVESKEGEGLVDLGCPLPSDVSGSSVLIAQVQLDDSLGNCRELATKELNGYKWSNGLLMHSILEETGVSVDRIVVPEARRKKVLKLAHDRCGHTGVRGMRKLLQSKFTWPGIHGDIVDYIKSCDVCLRVNKAGNRAAKMVERPIVSVPFESVAVDIVGPLPKAKRGVRYLFTYVCLATR